ncbi:MAG: AAA family ATPase, partial [Acidimicrobiaceae bacterium]|nr:AAA family ATPase [Acidimicrobiaceae bacterium]
MGQLWPLVGRGEEMQMVTSALGDGGVGAVVLSGEAGVGKTRLAREALRVAAEAGMVVCWSEATEQTRSIPLGAVAHILPEPPFGVRSLDGFERLSWAVRSVAALGQDKHRGLVVAIDDAHHLDDVTAALLQQLIAGGWATVLTTVRADRMPDWLKTLCQRDDGTHIPLQPLAQAEVQELLTRFLGGPIDAGTRVSLWRWSRGTALVLREVVAAGIEGGALQQRDGVWVWNESIALPARITSLIESRLEALDDSERAAMEILAVGESLSPGVLAELHLTGIVAGLEGKGLVESADGYERGEVRLRVSHPLYGEVLRAGLPSRRIEAIRAQLAAALETLGTPGGDDVLRV